MHNPNSLGKYLRLKRKEFQLTIGDVAFETGLSTSAISHIETGKFHSPTAFNLEKLAPFFGVSAVDLAKMIDLPSHSTQKYLAANE